MPCTMRDIPIPVKCPVAWFRNNGQEKIGGLKKVSPARFKIDILTLDDANPVKAVGNNLREPTRNKQAVIGTVDCTPIGDVAALECDHSIG